MKTYALNNEDYTASQLIEWCHANSESQQQWLRDNCTFMVEWLSGKNEFVVNTSGSTGAPKPIVMTRKQMTESALLTINYFKLPPRTRALLCLPSSFIAGKMMMVRALVGQWNLHWTEPSSNPLHDWNSEVDFAAFTPMQVSRMVEECPKKFEAITKIIVGGSGISDQLHQKLKQCKNQIWATYGMTETNTHVAVRRVTGEADNPNFHALPGVKFSTTEDGRLQVHAPYISDEPIVTNDMAVLITPLSFQLAGRADNVINSGGIKVFPEMIETKIAHTVNSAFYITSEPDEVLGEKLVMVIEGEAMSESEQLQMLSTMKLYLQPFEVPKKIYFVHSIARTPNGKIIRKVKQ